MNRLQRSSTWASLTISVIWIAVLFDGGLNRRRD